VWSHARTKGFAWAFSPESLATSAETPSVALRERLLRCSSAGEIRGSPPKAEIEGQRGAPNVLKACFAPKAVGCAETDLGVGACEVEPKVWGLSCEV